MSKERSNCYKNISLKNKDIAQEIGRIINQLDSDKEFQDYHGTYLFGSKWSKKGIGLVGPIRTRVERYSPRTDMFEKIDTRNGKVIGKMENPYKRVRKIKRPIYVKGH